MTNQEIESRLRILVARDNATDAEIIQLLTKAEENKTYLVKYRDMWSWLAAEFKMTGGTAHRRINAAQIARVVPGIATKVDDDQLNLTSLAALQTIFKAEEKRTGETIPAEQKAKIVEESIGKSVDETKRAALKAFPKAAKKKKPDQFRASGNETSGIRLEINKTKQAEFERARELLSHIKPGATWSEIVEYVVEYFVKNEDPLKKPVVTSLKPQSQDPTAPIPTKTRLFVLQRDRAACVVCASRYQVEVDHILCRALGGTNDPSNLRTLCRTHNQHAAQQSLGVEWATSWKKGSGASPGEATEKK